MKGLVNFLISNRTLFILLLFVVIPTDSPVKLTVCKQFDPDADKARKVYFLK